MQTVFDLSESKSYKWFSDSFENPSEIYDMKFDALAERVGKCDTNLEQLEEWIDYQSVCRECEKAGLSEFIDLVTEQNIASCDIIPVYKKRFYRLWLDAVMPNYASLRNFRHRDQEHMIKEFAELDQLQFEIARLRIKGQLINSLPSFNHFTKGVDEISVLKRELKKQRKIMPIRRLFKEIPNLLLALKPCLMMSPLSVSLFLEADTYNFDLVIFDEASQVFTENAIGAISRGKQVIIAGDSKQLPPTNFFQSTVVEGDYDSNDTEGDDEEDLNVYESILDEANMLPEKTLLWHYRSRHESLITFSNAKIYKNRLITFPSSTESIPGNGVEYIHVPNGFYDRGGRKGNVEEAKKVAELVFEHFDKNPKRSLGVITFGEVQQNAIDAQLRAMRIEDQSKESFFSEDREESFFIKSLENVQGDERDTIIFSIGYAKDINGVFRNQFGPLGKSGGERRLNVAITRAKYNVKLVGSILPTDINVEKIKSEGPKLLRSYIDYAINGAKILNIETVESDMVEHDSPFEEAVYNFLERKGYKLATQVGCSGYRIDMAVKHPTMSGIFVIGIECDGAAYHSARTARERDRLRQNVLESMGWKLYRIWSTDWIKDPVSEGERLLKAVDDAIRMYEIENSSSNRGNMNDNLSAIEAEYIQIENAGNKDSVSSYGFAPIASYNFNDLPRKNGFLDIRDCIRRVVENEYPIHFDQICQKLAYLYGNEKVTVKIRREVNWGLERMKGEIVRKEDFLFPYSYTTIPVRMPNNRQIQYISKDELAAAMMLILKQCIGTTRQALIDETARAYGFMRTGPKIAAAMDSAYEVLISSGKVEEMEGKIKLVTR